MLEDRMANGCRCEGAREEWRGVAGRQRKKESLFKDGEIPGATTEGGGGADSERPGRVFINGRSHHQCH